MLRLKRYWTLWSRVEMAFRFRLKCRSDRKKAASGNGAERMVRIIFLKRTE